MKTMNEVFDRYERDCLPKLGVRTQRDYVRHLAALRAYFGSRIPGSIQPREIWRFIDVDKGKMHRNKQVAVLSAVFSKAVGRWFVEGIDRNPCLTVKRHESYPRTRYVTDAEFSAVRALASEPVQLMMDLALLTGQRQGDLLDMTWYDVHAERIHVTQAKTGKQLGIRITSAVADVLQRSRDYKPFVGERLYIVRTRSGGPYTHEGFRALWQRTMDDALRLNAIQKRFTFHDLRAKCASDKANLNDASALLGHSDIGLTNRIYRRSISMVDPLR